MNNSFKILTTTALIFTHGCGSSNGNLLQRQEIENQRFQGDEPAQPAEPETSAATDAYTSLEEANLKEDDSKGKQDSKSSPPEALPPPTPEEVAPTDTSDTANVEAPSTPEATVPSPLPSNEPAFGDETDDEDFDDTGKTSEVADHVYFDLDAEGKDAAGNFSLVEVARKEYIKGLGFFFYKRKSYFEFNDANPENLFAGTTVSLKLRVFEDSKKETVALRMLVSGSYVEEDTKDGKSKGDKKNKKKDNDDFGDTSASSINKARFEIVVGVKNGLPFYRVTQNDHQIAEASLQTKLIANEENHVLLSFNNSLVGLTLQKETISSPMKPVAFQIEQANLIIGAENAKGKNQFKGFISAVVLTDWPQE